MDFKTGPAPRASTAVAEDVEAEILADLSWVARSIELRPCGQPSGARIEVRSLAERNQPALSRIATTDRRGVEELARTASLWNRQGRNVYFCINPVDPDCRPDPGKAVADKDIIFRAHILVDFDSVRSDTDAPATEEELRHACRRGEVVVDFLDDNFGFPEPRLVVTGNGAQALWRVHLTANEESSLAVRGFLQALACQFPDDGRAKIDTCVSNASRLGRLAGSVNYKPKASEDRPNRRAMAHHYPEIPDGEEPVGGRVLELADLQAVIDKLLPAEPEPSHPPGTAWIKSKAEAVSQNGHVPAYVRSAIERECAKVASAPVGDRHRQVIRSGRAIGGFLHFGAFSRHDMRTALMVAAAQCKLPDDEAEAAIDWALDSGHASPRHVPDRPRPAPSPGRYLPPDAGGDAKEEADPLKWIEEGDVATLADVRKALGETRYLWPQWVPFGSITGLISEAGAGKTRTVLDWAARLYFGEPLPGDAPNPLPAGTKTLWLCYDRNWYGLMDTARAFGLPEDAILLPTHKGQPLWLPDFDHPKTMLLLERIIKQHKPGFLAIDTTTYATRYDTAKAHETKIAYDPLMGIMAEMQTACVAITHTSREGNILNRRLGERFRIVLKLTRPDPNQKDRLKLAVDKSDDRKPDPLGVTFGDGRITYDATPPEPPAPAKPGPKTAKLGNLTEWLWNYIQTAPASVTDIVDAAREAGLMASPTTAEPKPSISSLYKAKDRIPRLYPGHEVEEFTERTPKGRERKHWKITEERVPF